MGRAKSHCILIVYKAGFYTTLQRSVVSNYLRERYNTV